MKTHIPKEIQELIAEYVSGKLNEQKTDELWALFMEHQEYLEYLKTVQTLHDIAAEEQKETKIHKLPVYKYVAAAAIFLILGFSSLIYFLSPDESTVQTLSAINSIELDIVRSADPAQEHIHILQTAITHSVKGEYDVALQLLEDVINNPKSQQQKHEATMLQGIIYFNLNRFDAALNSFHYITEASNVNPLMLEQAYWYGANAYSHLGKVEQSAEFTKRVLELDGAFSRVAARKMQNLTE